MHCVAFRKDGTSIYIVYLIRFELQGDTGCGVLFDILYQTVISCSFIIIQVQNPVIQSQELL
jgi:hypothetical protein